MSKNTKDIKPDDIVFRLSSIREIIKRDWQLVSAHEDAIKIKQRERPFAPSLIPDQSRLSYMLYILDNKLRHLAARKRPKPPEFVPIDPFTEAVAHFDADSQAQVRRYIEETAEIEFKRARESEVVRVHKTCD